MNKSNAIKFLRALPNSTEIITIQGRMISGEIVQVFMEKPNDPAWMTETKEIDISELVRKK